MPTDDVVVHFNELRQDIVLLYELKLALANCDYELETLRHRLETVAPGKALSLLFYQSMYLIIYINFALLAFRHILVNFLDPSVENYNARLSV
jgi:hypothetical protein